ncbi:MAG TPA: PA0069 family radical SAM protein [Steroidobacteraceae bacterium]|nr:PA0069 family radical SAM protein [Steroidobacteraceae bacterium]
MTRPLKGRGALSNPTGRFDRTTREETIDDWYVEPPAASVVTSVEPDAARKVISTNDSPDVPFEYSINPYRGCEHGCIYCLSGDTPILMGNGTTRPLAEVRAGDTIIGTERRGWHRRYIRTKVLAHWSVVKPAYRMVLEDGTELIAGSDHRFLTERGWKYVAGTEQGSTRRPHLTISNRLTGTGAFAQAPDQDADYRTGYLCGLIRGDGLIGSYSYSRRDPEALARAKSWLQMHEVETHEFVFAAATATRRAIPAIRINARRSVERIVELVRWPTAASRSWQTGFLAGIFDAAGSYSDGILRISNTDAESVGRTCEALRRFEFRFAVEKIARENSKPIDVVRVTGGLREHLRFFHSTDPAITRKRDVTGQAVRSASPLRVRRIERISGAMRLFDISTGTEDFIANGVVSHNCYARPSHAYLGLSSGLDFETRLFYKPEAGKLLTAELARPGYVCKPITLGANTDPYQPVEKRLQVTRSILGVLRECRHPVSIITKGTLILRDRDLLSDLARDGLAKVIVSVTTLDAGVKRTLEPRAASPDARLAVIRALVAAGIPVGVLVAPVIPAITDHELEAIVEAAAGAGAGTAGYVLLRLPHEVKALFREWLAEHFPLRADHVMSLVQSMRGGRDNDPNFGSRMKGTGPYAELLRMRFKLACQHHGIRTGRDMSLPTHLFRPPPANPAQMTLGL